MMRKLTQFSLSVFLCACISNAIADDEATNVHSGYYLSGNAGVGLVGVINDAGKKDNGFAGAGAGIAVGDLFSPSLGIEGAASMYSLSFTNMDIYDVVGRGAIKIGAHSLLLAKFGIGYARLRTCFLNCDSHDRVGPAFGLGYGYGFNPQWMGTLEYNGVYLSSNYADGIFGGLTLGVTRYFDA